jgi:hypothetical protein
MTEEKKIELIENKISNLKSKYRRKYGYRCKQVEVLKEIEEYIDELG